MGDIVTFQQYINVDALKQNGTLVFLDRPLEALLPTDDRPLADTEEKIKQLYAEREPVYRAAADEIIPVDDTPAQIADRILSIVQPDFILNS